MTNTRPIAALLFGMGLGLIGAAQTARACTCLPNPPPATALAEASRVFRGTVKAIEQPSGSLLNHYRFAVTRVWKGEASPVISVTSTNNSAACGVGFMEGREYLVYQSSDGFTSLCTRTRGIDSAGEDLAALGGGQAPQTASAAIAARHQLFSGTWYDPARNGEGAIVQVLADGSASVYWFGYRGLEPREQTWLVGLGGFDGDTLHASRVFRPVGGGFGPLYMAANVELVDWGELLLAFQPDGTLRLRWASTLPEYGSGTLTLRRLTGTPAMALP